jgi:arginine decarboxylase
MSTDSPSPSMNGSSTTKQDDPLPLALPDGYTVEDGRLHLHGLDLAALSDYWMTRAGLEDAPLTIRYMPSVRMKFQKAQEAFAAAKSKTNYPGQVRMAYASKANPNHAVIQTVIGAGADYECSSRVDMWIVRYAIEQGWLTPDKLIVANGFKTPGYADALISVASDGFPGVTPVFDSLSEVQHFANSGVELNCGVRFRIGDRSDRFGMDETELFQAAERIAEADNLTLTLFHAIQLYPAVNNPEYIASLDKALVVFNKLREKFPTLHWFDVGGGLPVQLAEQDDLEEWIVSIQQLALERCGRDKAPDLLIESGRYLTGSHQLEVFNVVKTKQVNGTLYYVLGGGIMSNLPDAWALGAEFPVAPLNHWGGPWRDIRLSGLTCDPDDIYPTKGGKMVRLPVETDGLLVAFLEIGAYQDILGGEGGAKHCLLSEGATIIIGGDPEHPMRVSYQPPQPTESVLRHLGYGVENYSTF